ncbi:hypothetical protein RND81_12G081000 [Saponaria officinalis]|uniref:Glycosyltransferase n=1 Tax=Saponaria officinalis TaxID=3572 RepID=A0AAW1H805_SAPOF
MAKIPKTSNQPHILVFPYPIQGHINPMLQFSKRLSSKGIKVTLITTITLSKSLPPQSQSGSIRIRPIDDGLKDGDTIKDHETYLKTFERVIPKSLINLIDEYNNTNKPVTFVVYDCIIPWVLDLTRKKGIDGAPFFTQSAAVHFIHYHVYKGDLSSPIKGDLVSVPKLPLLRAHEMPSLLVNGECYPGLNVINIKQSSGFHDAHMLFFNTIDKLEEQVLKWMSKKWPIKTIGPTIPSKYLDKRLEDDQEYGLSLFEPETNACIQWLDSNEHNSVIYISMGSLASLGEAQMEQLANGLRQCGKKFLWVIRASEESKLPTNFKAEIEEQGLIVNWCPQLAVLAHKAIGCFMTHCGWNSTLEAISLGVPLVAMPQWTDQPTNAKHITDVWRIGVRVKVDEKGIVTKDEVEACVRKVMEGETGVEFKNNVEKLRNVAKDAMEEGGSSDKNIEEFALKLMTM